MQPMILRFIVAISVLTAFTGCKTGEPSSTSRERTTFEMRLVEDQPSLNSQEMTLVHRPESDGNPEVLYVQSTVLLDQTALKSATLQTDNLGRAEIAIAMTEDGRRRFAQVTRESIGKRLAIIIGGQLYAAPRILTEIPGGKAAISGSFSEQEARELVETLNASLR